MYDAKDYRAAKEDEQKAVQLVPNKALYHDSLGLDLMYLGQNVEARKEFTKAIDLDSSHSVYYGDLARIDMRLGEYARAEKEARQAVDLDPKDPYSNYYLADLLYGDGKYSQAIGPAQLAANAYPDRANVQRLYGLTLWGMGQYKEAQKQLKLACYMSPTSSNYWSGLAEVDALAGDYDASAADAQKTIDFNPKDARAQYLLGVANLHFKHYPIALSAIKKAVSLEPDNPHWHLGLGTAEYHLGNTKSAMADWAIAAKSENPEVKSKAEAHLKDPEHT